MSASIPVLQCLAQGCKVAEKRVSTYAGTYEARALKVWRDASERYPRQQPFSGLADDGVPTFSETRGRMHDMHKSMSASRQLRKYR